MSKPRKVIPAQNALLGDLESIRTLLTQDRGEQPEAPPEDDSGVPLLDDVVDGGGLGINESLLVQPGDMPQEDAGGLDDAMFQALLGDEWREATSRLFDDARGAIDDRAGDWSPEHGEALSEALRRRMDAALKEWLKTLVVDNMGELRQVLLRAMATTLEEQLFRDQKPGGSAAGDDTTKR